MSNYIPVIGLEIHVELKTTSKMFCQCSADYFGKEPNTNTCPVCLGLPGALPVPNRKAIEWCIKIGKALNCTINHKTKFDRKHYSYPDLPKGYQISQYDQPVAVNGWIEVGGKKFRIHRVHQEEDTGKLIHSGADSLVDFNRSGVPLVEIVTEPDFSSAEEVKNFLQYLHSIIRYLDVSDADMEKGSMRMEPNISVKVMGADGLPNYKVEVKNVNSFNFVKRSIEFEITRQQALLEKGETPKQETRGFDEKSMKTVSQRSKEEAHDYRYFPEPDIPPLAFEQGWITSLELPELPSAKVQRYVTEYHLRESDAQRIIIDKDTSKFFETVVTMSKLDPQKVANLLINNKIKSDGTVADFVVKAEAALEPKQTDEDQLTASIQQVLSEQTDAVNSYKNGKESILMFLVGQVMQKMKGKADAQRVKEELLKSIK